ncbi:Small auxin-up RNA - like 10 [Theobroma cacao]|nr:Small auxin-up RNA - like 10 [Theobroma cacao]
MPKKVEAEEGKIRRAPKGHFVVYVGTTMTRFVIPTSFLKNPIFQQLLDKAAEEYGFNNQSRLILPCDEFAFQRLTKFLAQHCNS